MPRLASRKRDARGCAIGDFIGVLSVIGAQPSSVLLMVLKEAEVMVMGGIAAGLVLAMCAQKEVDAIFQTPSLDFGIYLLLLPSLLAVTFLAAYIPACRATLINPSWMLRYE